jgi:glycosyltransferase involved in cell wall biosynthesis
MSAVPYVSVGLPVYNGERFVARAAESVLSQTFADLELIISDNGSTDRTEEICRSIAGRDPRVRYHRNVKNVGAARNFNRVFELARGRYFRWAAHDDLCRPAFLARCVEVLDARPDVSISYARAIDVDESAQVVHEHPASTLATQAATAERVADLLLNPSPCIEAFGLMRREQLARTGLIGAYTASDRTMLLEMALQGRFHQVPEVLFLHGQHADRSVFRYRCAREMNAWFDPARAGKFGLPTWRLMAEYRRALRRAQLDAATRARCDWHLAVWAARNARLLARELAAGARHVLLRAGGSALRAGGSAAATVERLRRPVSACDGTPLPQGTARARSPRS